MKTEQIIQGLVSEVLLNIQLLFLLWLVIEDHDNLFIMAEVVHFLGIGVLIYKLWTKKNAGGEAINSSEWQLHLFLAACSGSMLRHAVILAKPEFGGLGCIGPPVMYCTCRSLSALTGADSTVPSCEAFLQVWSSLLL